MPVGKETWNQTVIPWWMLMGGIAALVLGIVMLRCLGTGACPQAALPGVALRAPVVRALSATEPIGYQPRELLPQWKTADGPALTKPAAQPVEVPM